MTAVAEPVRCAWAVDTAGSTIYRDYHDNEWGRPVHGTAALYERLVLEAFQSGLAWITILRKREAFRKAFAGFVPETVAEFGSADVERLLQDASIVRNRAKIEAAVSNARAVLDLSDTDLDSLLWSFAPPARPAPPARWDDGPAVTPGCTPRAPELKRRGVRVVGPTTAYALMQATGMVDDHLAGCWVPRAR